MDAFLAGALIKLYDDLVDDMPVVTNAHVSTAILTLQVAITTVVVAAEFWVCIAFVLFNLICAIARPKEYTSPWAFSHLLLSPVLLGLSWGTRAPFQTAEVPLWIAILLGGGWEANAFPENFSWAKTAVRNLGIVFDSVLLRHAPLSSSLRTALWIHVGYCLASSVIQMLMLTGLVPLHASPPVPA